MSENDFPVDDTVLGEKRQKLKSSELVVNKAVLIVLSENLFGRAFVINNSMMVIGRNRECDICLDDPLVSSEHCRIEIGEEGKYFIEDLGSTNSTFVNRKQLKKKTHLIYGDRIVIGKTILRFLLEEEL